MQKDIEISSRVYLRHGPRFASSVEHSWWFLSRNVPPSLDLSNLQPARRSSSHKLSPVSQHRSWILMNTYQLYVPNLKLYGHLEVLGSLFLITILQWNSGEVATTITLDDVESTCALYFVLFSESNYQIHNFQNLPQHSHCLSRSSFMQFSQNEVLVSPIYSVCVPMLETTSNSSSAEWLFASSVPPPPPGIEWPGYRPWETKLEQLEQLHLTLCPPIGQMGLSENVVYP